MSALATFNAALCTEFAGDLLPVMKHAHDAACKLFRIYEETAEGDWLVREGVHPDEVASRIEGVKACAVAVAGTIEAWALFGGFGSLATMFTPTQRDYVQACIDFAAAWEAEDFDAQAVTSAKLMGLAYQLGKEDAQATPGNHP